MMHITINTLSRFIFCLVFTVAISCSAVEDTDFSERTKIALRDAGNKLLLSQQDSTSLILPVIKLNYNTYQLAFNEPLSFEPTILVSILGQSLITSSLPEHYIVEVLQCSDREVAYSYQMSVDKENTIIPCAGRYLPLSCYIIEVKFVTIVEDYTIYDVIISTIILLVLFGLAFLISKKLKPPKSQINNGNKEKIGSFYFYPEQNKLVKEAVEIALSKKECELLTLFVANPNQIIKRDELTKRVWEDNGVFVGRSLDTYISKLRKKLKSDASIKLTNVHGIGYKLEL